MADQPDLEILFIAGMYAAAAIAALGATFLDRSYRRNRSTAELVVTGGLCGAISAAICGLAGLVDDWVVLSRVELLCFAVLVGSIGPPVRDLVTYTSRAFVKIALKKVGVTDDDADFLRKLPDDEKPDDV